MAYVKYANKAERETARAKAYAEKLEWLKTEEGREYQLNARMKSMYGMTLAEYREKLEGQGGLCKLCKKPAEENTHGRLYVDHCHVTGAYRGLLCNKCNRGLGQFNDDLEVLLRAVEYLKEATNVVS